MDASPSMISPSDGIVSPASQIKISPFFSCELLTVVMLSFAPTSLAGVSSRVFRKLSACALPRASAMASAKLAKSKVTNSTMNTNMLYPNEPCVWSPVTAAQRVTRSITNVTISTMNMIGFRNIVRGSSFTNDCLKLSITSSLGNKEAAFLSFILFILFVYRYEYYTYQLLSVNREILRNRSQRQCREERQSGYDKDHTECHHGKCRRIRL